jgi:hypothetical protein
MNNGSANRIANAGLWTRNIRSLPRLAIYRLEPPARMSRFQPEVLFKATC